MSILSSPFQNGLKPVTGPYLAGYISVLAVIVVVGFYPDFLSIAPAAALFAVAVSACWRRLSPISMAPAMYLAWYLAVIAISGFFLANALVGAGGTGGIDGVLSLQVRSSTTNSMLLAAALVVVSAAAVRGRVKGPGPSAVLHFEGIARFSFWFLAVGTIELLALVNSFGISGLISRGTRFLGRGTSFDSIILMAAIATVVLVSIAMFSTKGFSRLYATLLLLLFIACFISLGSRRLALIPILILLGYAIAKGGRLKPLPVAVAVLLAVFALSLPLHFRGQAEHGLLPYLSSLSSFEFTASSAATSLNNIIAGYKITALTGFESPRIDMSILWVTLNPVSGDSAGWYDVARQLRLNRFTPYSAIGELINYGPMIFALFFVSMGVILGLVQRINGILLEDELGKFAAILALGLIFMFVIQSGQYNLRSILRYVYLAVGAQMLTLVLLWMKGRRREGIGPR